MRLNEERKNWQEKIKRIDVRLKQIEKIEKLLQQQMAQMDMKDREEKIAFDVQDVEQTAGKERRELVIKY